MQEWIHQAGWTGERKGIMATATAEKIELVEDMTVTLIEDIWEGHADLHGLRIDTGTTGTVEYITKDEVQVKFTFDYHGRTYTDYAWIDLEQVPDYFEGFEDWTPTA